MNPKLNKGDKFQVGTNMVGGYIMWGTIQTAQRIDPDGSPVYRPKWGKVDKKPHCWRKPLKP
jgi:hypothetical protein